MGWVADIEVDNGQILFKAIPSSHIQSFQILPKSEL